MKENHNDAIFLMLEELDQITVDELRRKPEYQACLKEHFELGNRLKDISPDLERFNRPVRPYTGTGKTGGSASGLGSRNRLKAGI